MRASRLVSIVMLLQARGSMTAAQLSRDLEVSSRTIYRDAQALCEAGVPLVSEAGEGGGYRLLAGWQTTLTGLTDTEVDALFLTGVPGAADELGLSSAAATAALKLQAALPRDSRHRAVLARSRVYLDHHTWYDGADGALYLRAIAQAVWAQRRITIRYRRWRAPENVLRCVEPYGLVLKSGRRYLVAATNGDELRTYRVDQIVGLTRHDETFTRPDDFRLSDWWHVGLARFRAELQRGTAVVRLSPSGRQRVAEVFGADAEATARESAARPDADGWVTVALPIESVPHAVTRCLALGSDLEVLEPTELRSHLARVVHELAGRYEVTDTGCQRHRHSLTA